jgi:hypothetical protein
MRGTRAKSLRKYVAATFPFLPTGSQYQQRADGVIHLVQRSQRALYQFVKANYKRSKKGLEIRSGLG